MFKKNVLYPVLASLMVLILAACTVSPSSATGSVVSGRQVVEANPVVSNTPTVKKITYETSAQVPSSVVSYPIVDTGQNQCYDARSAINCPAQGSVFYGQDAQYTGNTPSYTDNGDGTVTDNVTGLVWSQSPDLNGDGTIDAADKLTYDAAMASAETFSLAGYTDWRLPTIKELYSLIDFRGTDPSLRDNDTSRLVPFVDTDYFDFGYGDTAAGERIIDAQFASSTKYVSTTMNGSETMFGVNLADGRIKGYGLNGRNGEKTFYVLYARGNPVYGENDFVDNGDGTISDRATGLMWAQDDSGVGLSWEDALAWVEQKNAEGYLGYSDWRLPNAKELQSIVDYTRSPDTTGSAATDPLFNATPITNEAGQPDYAAYWSSTTHLNASGNASRAVYVTFGRGLGSMDGTRVIDVHGAGCQRSDPKSGSTSDFPSVGHGPQGDVQRVFNYVRLVRDGDITETPEGMPPSDSGISVEPPVNQPAPPDGQQPGGQQQPGQDSQLPEVQQPGQGNQLPGGQPPQEAVEACVGKSQGNSCQVDTPHGTIDGTCTSIQQQLVCVPENGPSGQNGQPPAGPPPANRP